MRSSVFLLGLMLSIALTAQTPFSVVNSHGTTYQEYSKSASLANPWIGAKVSKNFNENLPIDQSFLLSAKVLYAPLSGPGWSIPVVTTVGIGNSDIFNPDAGINLGVYPYYNLSKQSSFQFVVHGALAYKVIESGVPEEADNPEQFKVSAGFEAILSPPDGGAPTTLSIAPTYMFNNISDDAGGLEITGVLPIATGLGILAESYIPFKEVNSYAGNFRLGIIANINIL